MSNYQPNGPLNSKLSEIHSDITELSGAVIELRTAVYALKDSNRESAGDISRGLVNLSNSIKLQTNVFKTAVPIKLVLIMLLSTIVAIGIGRELDILLKVIER